MSFKNTTLIFFLLLLQQTMIAQVKRFCPEQVFLCVNATSSSGLGYDSNPTKGHCYKWTGPNPNTQYFTDDSSPNPKLKVIPGNSLTFEVTVTTDDGNMIVNKVNVYIYELKLEIFHSRVMDENNLTNVLAGVNGAQTFINIDNDDNDNDFDISDKEVTGGDNELMKLKASINVIGADFPVAAAANKIVALFLEKMDLELNTTKGENAIKLWKFENKKEIFGDGKKGTFSLEKNELQTEIISNVKWKTATIWIEGIEANTITQGTEFELKVKDEVSSGNCNKAITTATVAEISAIEWIGIENGEDGKDTYAYSGVLPEKTVDFADADNPSKTWSSTSVRVFPDGRYNSGTISASKDKVKVKITITPELHDAFTLYVKSFDMDDPSQNADNTGKRNQPPGSQNLGDFVLDPNDVKNKFGTYIGTGISNGLNYTKENDNRARTKKTGEVSKGNGISALETVAPYIDVFSVKFSSNQTVRDDIEFTVSQFAGDNYTLYAYCDKDYLKNIKNTDAIHGDKIMNVIKDDSSIPCLLTNKFQSKTLTVWRLLHLEIDEMQLDEKINEAKIYFTDFESPTNSSTNIQKIIGMPNLTKIKTCECAGVIDDNDNSLNLSETPVPPDLRNGRFEKGNNTKIKIGVSEDYTNVTNSLDNIDIRGNGNNFLEFDKPLNLKDLKCTLKKGTLSMDCKLIEVTKNGDFFWKLSKNGSTNSFSQFTGGKILFGNSYSTNEEITIESISDNGMNGTIKTLKFKIYAILTDDDMKIADGANKITDLSNIVAFEKAFIQCVNDGGGIKSNNQTIPFASNVPFSGEEKCIEFFYKNWHQSENLEKDNFGIVYVARLWQGGFTTDYDATKEGADNGYTLYPFAKRASIVTLKEGYEVSFIFRETVADYKKNSPKASQFEFGEETTIIHEIGHQFGLTHGDKIADPDDLGLGLDYKADMGIMGGGDESVTENPRTSKDFMPIHLSLIRSRSTSPGQ